MGCSYLLSIDTHSTRALLNDCHTLLFYIAYRGISALAPRGPHFSDLVPAGLFSHIFLLLSHIYIAQCFLQFLKYVIVSEVPTVSLTGSALASGKSGLDLVGTGSVQHRGSL